MGMKNDQPDRLCHDYDKALERKTTFISRAGISAPADTVNLDALPENATASSSDLDRASNWSEDMQGLGHLDPQRSILLRFECMSSGELKVSARC